MRNNFYFPFLPAYKNINRKQLKEINYIYLLKLYSLAQFDFYSGFYSRVEYNTLKELAENLNISYSTLNRLLSNSIYTHFYSIDKQKKIIDIKKVSSTFVMLNKQEIEKLLILNDSTLIAYYFYIIYNIGNKENTTFTASQFLESNGFKLSSKDRISHYNRILEDQKLITILHYTDENGFLRNIYKRYKSKKENKEPTTFEKLFGNYIEG